MGEAKDVMAELLKILPENDWLRAAIVVFALLLVVLREKLFTGTREICRYIYRWALCRYGRHTWRYYGLGDLVYISGAGVPSNYIYKCVICLKDEKRPAEGG